MDAPHAPRILITRAEIIDGEDWQDYAACIERAGGVPVPVDVLRPIDVDALPPHEGVMLTAGVDIDPARYGEARSERVVEVNPVRDAAEETLVGHARLLDLPLLAICRGHQLLNVDTGGGLLQHLAEREPHRARRGADCGIASGWHEVAVHPGTLLESITGASALRVNSRHHQAVTRDRVAPGLVASAWTEDGVVEALEDPRRRWFLGVQWHPERTEMAAAPEHRAASVALFEAFVAACRGR
ncbi:MAG: gamma-glutamyl-gamma-aminobutyrate hydrolase family protein [Dehalococcoidia bacterium]